MLWLIVMDVGVHCITVSCLLFLFEARCVQNMQSAVFCVPVASNEEDVVLCLVHYVLWLIVHGRWCTLYNRVLCLVYLFCLKQDVYRICSSLHFFSVCVPVANEENVVSSLMLHVHWFIAHDLWYTLCSKMFRLLFSF